MTYSFKRPQYGLAYDFFRPNCGCAFRISSPRARPCTTQSSAQIAHHGSFNFILSNGEFLPAHCSTRLHYVIRQYPFARAQLVDCDIQIDFNRHNHLDDRMAVIATEPLTTGETWVALAPGELKMFADGAPHPAPAHTGAQSRQLCISY